MNRIDHDEMIKMLKMAEEAKEHAYAPYSEFKVGACLKASSGKYYLGCNIENVSYGATNCAERTAVFKAVYEGEREFDGIAIASSGTLPSYPCGICRQVLSEFCSADMPVILNSTEEEYIVHTLGDMLPFSFSKDNLI